MGYSKVDTGLESEGKKWVIAGIAMRTTLKPVKTKPGCSVESEEEYSTTPTAKESRIPDRFPCPPAPRKRKPTKSSSSSRVEKRAGCTVQSFRQQVRSRAFHGRPPLSCQQTDRG